LVAAGQHGRRRNNIANDIISAAAAEGFVSSQAGPYEIKLTTGGVGEIFLPHEFVPSMIGDSDISEWCLSPEVVAGGLGLAKLLRDWANHPEVQFAGDLSKVPVVGFHCDGVQDNSSVRAGGSRSIVVGSMNIISAASAGRKQLRQPLRVLRKGRLCSCGCMGFHTIQEFMEVLAWSMGCMATGQAPTCRHDGSPWSAKDLANKRGDASGQDIMRGALLQARGDWEWMEQCFRCRSVNSERFCWMCDATQKIPGPLDYHDFRPEAAHRQTLISHEMYFARCASEGEQPSHLFRCPGFRIEHLAVDSMHAGDLGTFQDAIGSLFFLEISHRPWFPNRAAGLKELNETLNMFYRAHQDQGLTKATPLVITQILAKEPGYPYLKAKAAETRHLVGFCRTLAHLHQSGNHLRPAFCFRQTHRLAEDSQLHCDLLVSLFDGLYDYVASCAAEPFVADVCRRGMFQYLQALKQLHDLWRRGLSELEQKPMPFHIRPKAHGCQHLVQDKVVDYGSPSAFWGYGDEDFVGHVKRIARKTCHPATLETKVGAKLRILSALL
jgi:hypothetical protein